MNDRLEFLRLKQPLHELKRKAEKSICLKSKLWTQEELDYAKAHAQYISALSGWSIKKF